MNEAVTDTLVVAMVTCFACGALIEKAEACWYRPGKDLPPVPICRKCYDEADRAKWPYLFCERKHAESEPPPGSSSVGGMTRATFDTIIAELNDYIASLRDDKQDEYASDEDTLRNFHVLGPVVGLSPAQYCVITLVKHIGALAHQIMSSEWVWAYRLPNGGEGLKQRIADSKNSLDLLFALLYEESEGHMPEEDV